MTKSPRIMLLASDLHSGSIQAPIPPGFVTEDGNQIGMNPTQEWLWECWEDCWKQFNDMKGDDEWAFLFNGDATEGVHHKTTEVISHNVGEHIRCCVQLLKPKIKGCHSAYIIDGTECHTGHMESAIAHDLKDAGINVIMPDHGGAWPEMNLEMCGKYIHAAHHVGTTSRPYLEASGIGINMNVCKLEQARAKHKQADIVVRSHRHRYGMVSDGHTLGIVTYPWQTLTRHGRKVVTNAKPEVGLIALDWRGRQDGDMPAVWEFAHTVKQPTIHKL